MLDKRLETRVWQEVGHLQMATAQSVGALKELLCIDGTEMGEISTHLWILDSLVQC